jgi:hypothetical protein
MINRKILYGYVIQNGDIVTKVDEATVVARVFTLYGTDLSYQKISDTLNGENIPYCQDAPVWNKHKVKRLLENPRYTGQDGYPAIIDGETFCKVQAQIQGKTAGYAPPEHRPVLDLKDRLRCGCCNGSLHRTAGKNRRNDTLYLKCDACGTVFTMTDDELLGEITRQISEYETPVVTAYQPSEEVIRLTNAINRGLENPESPEEVVSLILRGAAARYDCCPAAIQYESTDRQPTVDWNHIRQAVSYITISAENTVTAVFR